MNETIVESDKVRPENAETILDQAEKRLKGTLDDAEMLDGRRTNIAMIYLAMFSAICGVLIHQFEGPNLPILAGSISSFVFLLWSIRRYYENVLKHGDYQLPGLDPQSLLRADLVELDSHRFKVLIAKTYQDLIEANAKTNRRWGDGINDAIADLLKSPFVFIASALLAEIIRSVCRRL